MPGLEVGQGRGVGARSAAGGGGHGGGGLDGGPDEGRPLQVGAGEAVGRPPGEEAAAEGVAGADRVHDVDGGDLDGQDRVGQERPGRVRAVGDEDERGAGGEQQFGGLGGR